MQATGLMPLATGNNYNAFLLHASPVHLLNHRYQQGVHLQVELLFLDLVTWQLVNATRYLHALRAGRQQQHF